MPLANTGHGHVIPRADGFKAQCGGPMLCVECAGVLSDHTMKVHMINAVYCNAFERMAKINMQNVENGLAHQSGLLAIYLRGFEDGGKK